jgi:anti-sigma factor RsiW
MSCAEFAADLSAWIDRELPAARAAAVAAHVAACAACRAQVEELRRADGALRAVPLREMPPGALAEVLRRAERGARGEAGRASVSRGRLLRWAAAPAAAAAAGVAIYLVVRPTLRDAELDAASPEELAVAIDLDTVEDLEVIANLEVLEAIVAQDGGSG